ncbi:MAG TPA: hypothetical protein VJ140_19385 [Actinomycetota bacterium]|nr:hypothetical protein [Actinomycetota bacterium]
MPNHLAHEVVARDAVAHPLIGGDRQVEVPEQRTIDDQRPVASTPRLGGASRREGGEVDAEKGETR